MAKIMLAMLLAFLGGCSETGGDKSQRPSIQGTPVDISSLPANVSEGDGYPPPAPDLCVWATSVDALVWGRLVDVRLTASPAINSDNAGWTWTAKCAIGANPALELEVDIIRSLRGGLTGRVVAHLGSEQVGALSPLPHPPDPGKTIDWLPVTAITSTRGPLLPGRPIGLALQYVPALGIWSVMGQAMFGVGSDSKVFFQECHGPAFEPGPKQAAGMTPAQFDATVAACAPTQATAQRRAWVLGNWGPPTQWPSLYVAASCHQAP